jgi:hypothetical protein
VPGLSLALQAPVFALLAVVLTTAGHISAHGNAPSLTLLALLFVGALLVRARFADRPRSLAWTLTALLGVQAIGHLLMSLDSDVSTSLDGGPLAPLAISHSHGSGTLVLPILGASPGSEGPSGITMVLAHVAVGLALAWWLHRGEVRAWTLARRLLRYVVTPRHTAAPSAPTRLPVQPLLQTRLVRLVLLDAPGRAPPLVAAPTATTTRKAGGSLEHTPMQPSQTRHIFATVCRSLHVRRGGIPLGAAGGVCA